MITIETGTYRFFTGDNVHYHNAAASWLIEQVASADEEAMRRYAAAGLMRGLLDIPVARRGPLFMDSVDWAHDVITHVLAGEPDVPTPAKEVQHFVEALKPVNGVWDATSVKATNANRPAVMANIIDRYIPKSEGKLVIGIGHGGILSSLATYSALDGYNAFYPVRFSRYKTKDLEPALANNEKEWLKYLARERAGIVHDEDRGLGGNTIRETVRFINKALGVSAVGVTPVLARHPGGLWPEVVRETEVSSRRGFYPSFKADVYDPWSKEFEALVSSQTAEA